ncbi:LCP family protein [Streptomyces sp. T-3]|nr:LCP family protein [Streptomyces sp. T-3]
MRHLTLTVALVAALAGGTLTAAGPPPKQPGQDRRDGTNILVVGIDRRAGLSVEERNRLHVGGQQCDCTDVMMVVHLAEDGRRMSVVSVLRDSYVEFAEHKHPPGSRKAGKINEAFQRGGADLAKRTVERATGLRIDHYLETDFTGFVGVVDRLGGATVCTDKLLRDKAAGLRLTPGTHLIDGKKALRYVRARHVNPPGDGGRVRRQQRLLAGLITRMREARALDGPAATLRTVAALRDLVRTDSGTNLADLVALGSVVGRLRPEQTEFANVPVAEIDHRVPGAGSTVLWDRERSDALWSALREDRPLTGDPRIQPQGGVRVGVPLSAIHVRASDEEVAFALLRAGFTVLAGPPDHAPPQRADRTVIYYDPDRARYTPALTAALPGARLVPVRGHGRVFDIHVGSRDRTVVPVIYDRSGVEGPPVTGDRMLCP